MARGRATLEWDQTALLWALQININRDTKKQPKPFLPSEVHPYRTEADYQPDQGAKRAISSIKRTCKVKKLQNVSISNRSRESISQAPG